jgi:hypothetical protein
MDDGDTIAYQIGGPIVRSLSICSASQVNVA